MGYFRISWCRGLLLAALLLSLAGCLNSTHLSNGPGPGGGGGGGGTLPPPDALAPPQPAVNFETPEFFVNHGLNQIGAQNAYAGGAYGGGVVVAVIDTGIDTTHTDLDANISAASIDIVRGGPLTDIDGHGTHVSGIIAAEKNDIGTHGVAFDATILAIRADTVINDPIFCSPAPAPCSIGFTETDIVAALNYAAGKAHVVNMSLGGPAPLSAITEVAFINAMAAGAIIVAATGNDGATQPGWPAAYAGDTAAGKVNGSGQLIAVGAVDSTGTIATFSNDCGAAMNYCLVAPGVDIVSTLPGGGTQVLSGTSMAAPHVSGGAALLIQMFPTLTPAQVVQILLVTATDLGVVGVDAVYGHGLLNLAQAVLPVGTLSVPLTDSVTGESVEVNVTVLSLGPAFGDALTGNALLDRALALDDFDRPYVAGLGAGVIQASRGFGLEALLAAGDVETVETVEAALPGGLSLAMGVSGNDDSESLSTWPSGDGDENATALHELSLSGETAGGIAFRLGHDVTPEQQLSGATDTQSAGLYWMAGDTLSPHYALVGAGNGVTVAREIGGATTAMLGWVDRTNAADAGDTRIGEMSMAHRFGGGSTLRAGFALIDETGGFLGSDAAGAFAVEGASSRVYTASGVMPLGAGVELVGSYTVVNATMEADGTSLLSDWSAVRADAFGLGVARRGVFGAGDRIGLLVGQPLRVRDAAATLTAPVDYMLDKTVIQDSERISLVPTGREIDLQLAYDAELPGESRVSTWLMMQVEPGHVADAAPAYGVGLRFSSEF